MLLIGRWTTLGFVLWSVYFAFQMMYFDGSVYTLFQTLMSFVVGPTLGVLMAGMLSSRTAAEGALPGFFAGLFTSTSLFVLNLPGVYHWLNMPPLFRIDAPYLYYSIWSFLATISVTVVFSYFARPDSVEKTRYSIWDWREEGGAA